MDKINISEKFGKFNDQWTPKIVAELNEDYVKLAKIEGTFDWHKHEGEDEMFFVVTGQMDLHLKGKVVAVKPGEMIVVPKGVLHKPVAKTETQIMMIEKKTTVNTGNVVTTKTKTHLDWI